MVGALAKAISGVEAEKTSRKHKQISAAHAKLQKRSKKVVQKGRVLSAGEAQYRIQKRREKR
jgi:hypothetical protein